MKTIYKHIFSCTLGALLILIIPTHALAQRPGFGYGFGFGMNNPQCTTYQFAEKKTPLYLDVYKPDKPRADKATVITLFGGGFYEGSRNNYLQKQTARELTERGFTVISIDYRLGFLDKEMVETHSTLFKVTKLFKYCINIAVEDCADAIAWVCANSEMLDIDPSKIILSGSSAGAITVLQLDYSRANSIDQAASLPQGWKPAAVVPYSGGIMCFDRKLKYATDPAPTMLMHGTKDRIVSYKKFGLPFGQKMHGAKKVDKAMNRQDIPHWIIRFEDMGHEVAGWLPGSIDLFCSFADLTLSGRTTTLDATMTDSNLRHQDWASQSVLRMYGSKR